MAGNAVFGIDLGTTNSCIAMWKDGRSVIIPNDLGENTTPSCVSFTDNGILVGKPAVSQQNSNPVNTIFEVKRVIGQTFETVEKYAKYLPYNLASGASCQPEYDVTLEKQAKTFNTMEVSGIILQKLKEDAEKITKQKVILSRH